MMTANGASTLQILALVGSLRARSYNGMLYRAARELAPSTLAIEQADIASLPLYNADLDTEEARPEPVVRLRESVANADGILVVTPEYNHSIPGVLQNAIDWASRPGMGSPYRDRPIGMMGASGGLIGTARAQQQLKVVMLSMLALPMPHPGILVTTAAGRFDESGTLVDEQTREMVADYMTRFEQWIRRLAPSG